MIAGEVAARLPQGFLGVFGVSEQLTDFSADRAVAEQGLRQCETLHTPVFDLGLVVGLPQHHDRLRKTLSSKARQRGSVFDDRRRETCSVRQQGIEITPQATLPELHRQAAFVLVDAVGEHWVDAVF